jgi:hypothetical protein
MNPRESVDDPDMTEPLDGDLRDGNEPDTVPSQPMTTTPHNRSCVSRIAPLAFGCLLAVGACLGGCSTTSHDEYFAIREIVVEPARGDGTLIASRVDARESDGLLADASRPARGSNSTVLATE